MLSSELLVPSLALVGCVWGLWFFGGYLAEKIKSQATQDRRGNRVSRADNPRLFSFHVAKYCVLLTMLAVTALGSLFALVSTFLRR